MNVIDWINLGIMIAFFLCCFYQGVYIPVAWFKKPKAHKPEKMHRFAVLIAARNEELVIPLLIESIRAQDYPKELIDIYVMADNCTDRTAEVAENAGAKVYERQNLEKIGKGYVMHDLIERIRSDGYFGQYDGFFIFDADNVIRPDYFTQMNRSFSDGYSVVTGYRNSKNFGDNWLTAGVALWFLRETRYLNYPRCLVGSSSAIGGTGFCVSRELLERYDGWNFFTLTEDLEFTSRVICDGYKIGFCKDAMLYDEQPDEFRQSWRQRLRWSRGYLQMLKKYGGKLLKNVFKRDCPTRFAAYDILMNTVPPILMGGLALVTNVVNTVLLIVNGAGFLEIAMPLLKAVLFTYAGLFAIGLITMISEWKYIHTTTVRKILFTFTFPLFMFTLVPISIQALFCKVEWKPIHHKLALSRERIEENY